MLQLEIGALDLFEEETSTFYVLDPTTIQMEHSLLSISRWEAEWKKPFFAREAHTEEQWISYFKYMTITRNVDPLVYTYLSEANRKAITDYISDPMTATSVNNGTSSSNSIVTSEVIYGWLVSLQIPFEVEKWHINRLTMLVQVVNASMSKGKKLPMSEVYSQQREINAMRRAAHNSKG